MAIKPNCQKCYYGGGYKPNEHLACCNAPYPKEPTVIKFDELYKRERQFVKRKKWDDECDCGNFIPSLSEADGDFELEAVCTFNASFDCPFCGERIDVFDLGIEETELVKCDWCGKQIAVHGKSI
jgi:hypothetical protein